MELLGELTPQARKMFLSGSVYDLRRGLTDYVGVVYGLYLPWVLRLEM